MIRTYTFSALMAICFIPFLSQFMSCTPPAPAADLSAAVLIPQPVSLTATGSSFVLTESTQVLVADASGKALPIAETLVNLLAPAIGTKDISTEGQGSGNITLQIQADATQLGAEGYSLEITESGVVLSAPHAAGLFYGVQTIRQLLPDAIEGKGSHTGPWILPSGTIEDYPAYGYRGAMLDVSRHFFGVDIIKRYLDLLAVYKINALHLHLSDDQGWRIEIKSWPNLTKIGGSTEVGGGEGGFYTQEQYTEIVQYAAERHITIVPEIDVPGHTNAALASYAELNCNGKATELYTGTEVGFSTLCTDKEITYQFMEDVIRELAAITPGPYIHIGGDESNVTPLEDYIPFINRVQGIVNANGKQVLGWDEVAHAKLVPGAVVQYWDKSENALAAVKQGAKVLMSPAKRAYMDMQYDSTTQLGLHWAAYIEIDQAYQWDPATLVEGIGRDQIIGIEAPLWSETLEKIADIEYMTFPRLPGYAEIGWSPTAKRDWETYKTRLGKHGKRMEALGINFYRSAQIDWE